MTILNIYEFGKVNIVEIPQYNHSAGKIKNLTDHYYLVICFEADQRLLQHVGSFSFVGECVWVCGGVLTGFHYATQASLELMILLSQLPMCYDSRCVPLCPLLHVLPLL